MNGRLIIVNPTVLSEEFIPPYINEREHHIKWLMSALFPAVRGRKPVNVWIHGRPGTGKTCVSRFVLKKLQERWENVRGIYVNCWKYNTLYSILDYMIREFRILGGEAPSTPAKLDRFLKFVKDKPFIIILDEIDFPSPKEANNVLYSLSRNGNIGIVCISRSESAYAKLDDRVRSRLSARILEFERYDTNQIITILTERASRALKVGSWKDLLVKLIAELSQGDIRIGLEVLKSAAEYAESEGDKIGIEHIHKGLRNIKEMQRESELKDLSPHYRLIYNIIQQKPEIQSGELWMSYVDVCKKTDQMPVARRTFSAYIARLEDMQLIASQKTNAMGKIRSFKTL